MKFLIAVKHRLPAVAVVLLFTAAAIGPALLQPKSVSAAQFTERQIRPTSSKRGQTDVTYVASFKPTQTGQVLGFVIEFCADTPLVGAACTGVVNGNSLEGFNVNDTTLAVTGSLGPAWAVDTGASDDNTIILTRTAGASDTFTSGTVYTITLGGAGGADGITNPNSSGTNHTYYARILSYATAGGAQAYASAAPGTHLDDGGLALSTANQLTVSARVQEQLEFCVAALTATVDTDAETPANCLAAPFDGSIGTTVDIGSVDSTATSVTPVVAASGGNNFNGAVLVRTNAAFGVTISYFAEQDTSSGSLKVVGATCGSTVIGTGSTTDQCFNSAGATQADFSTSGEKFGMTASLKLKQTTDVTDNLTRDTDYDGDGSLSLATGGFAWVDSGANNPAETLASSTNVVNYEMLVLRFAARAAATTPTGAYTVTSTYIATSKF